MGNQVPCALCGLRGWGTIRFPGTDKAVCVPCISLLEDLKKKYVGDIIQKAQKNKPEVR